MIRIFKTEDGAVHQQDETSTGCWVALTDPTATEILEIADQYHIDPDDLRAPLDEEERSRIEVEDDYTLILVDIPLIEERNGKDWYETIPMGIVTTEEAIITVCLEDTAVLSAFMDGRVRDFHTYMKTRFILQMLYKNAQMYLQYLRVIDKKSGEIEKKLHQSTKNQELIELLQVNVAHREQTSDDPLPQAANAYDRQAAVAYAKQWVTDRNDEWPDYSMSGGNCQNFVSQCLLAGGIPMDSGGDAVWKWYGDTPNNLPQMAGRSASWSGVDEFLQYAANNTGSGMVAVADADYYSGEIGDVLILGYDEENLYHAVIITDVVTDEEGNVVDYLVHSNTANQESFPASAYGYTYQVLVKICGWN